MLSFDEDNLYETAELLRVINPYAEGMTIEGIVNHMKRTAYDVEKDLGYVSTLGYTLSAYKAVEGGTGIKASISSYTLKQYLQKKGKMK